MIQASRNFSVQSRGFHKYTRLALMPILALEVLLRENKKMEQNITPS